MMIHLGLFFVFEVAAAMNPCADPSKFNGSATANGMTCEGIKDAVPDFTPSGEACMEPISLGEGEDKTWTLRALLLSAECCGENAYGVCDYHVYSSQVASEENHAHMSDGDPESYIPSLMSLVFSQPATEGVEIISWDEHYTGSGKILVYATSKYLLETSDGKYFNTGHHTSEFLLPLHHLMAAGFTNIDIATKDGGRVALEGWTYPLATGYDQILRDTETKLKDKLDSPIHSADVSPDLDGYIAIFMPGGHGPLIEVGKDPMLGKLLHKAQEKNLSIVSLCHGPVGFRSAALPEVGGEFPFAGYKIAMFPDSADIASPSFGYLPGQLREDDFAEAALKKLGMVIVNTEMDDTVVADRNLITGASQKAAQKLGVLAAKALLEHYGEQITCGEIKHAYKNNQCCGQPEKPFIRHPNRRMEAVSDSLADPLLAKVDNAMKKARATGDQAKVDDLVAKVRRAIETD